MKILYDHQTFTLQDYGGISRYFYEICREFKSYQDVEARCTVLFSNNEYIHDNETIPHFRFFPKLSFKGKRTMMLAVNGTKSRWLYNQQNFDLFHPTYYDPYYLKFKTSKPLIITCLDLIHEKFIPDDLKTLDHKKKVLLRADKILAISQSTKDDLISHYKIPSNKIDVTHLASSISNKDHRQTSEIPNSSERFFLYVGKRDLYKNFDFFITAIAPLLKEHKDLFVYCAGGGMFSQEELVLFDGLKIRDKIKVRSASDESLIKLYSTAIAFFYPSLYEGFGIPLLEAMNCGCPVAASNTSSLPEVGGDAICYFDPLNKSSIFDVASSLLNDYALQQCLREKGYQRAKEFSWKKTAAETYNSYLTLI